MCILQGYPGISGDRGLPGLKVSLSHENEELLSRWPNELTYKLLHSLIAIMFTSEILNGNQQSD